MGKIRIGLSGFLTVVLLAAGIASSGAQEIPALHQSIRALGMGGAFTAVANDESALFYNPAGLNEVNGFAGVEILNPLLETSASSVDLYSDLSGLEGGDMAEVIDFLQARIGDHQHVRISLFPNVLIHNFGVGVLVQGVGDMEIHNPALPRADVDVRADVGVVAGAAYHLGKGVQIGVAGKVIQRRGVSRSFFAVDIAGEEFDPLEDLVDEQDYALDAGAKIRVQEWWNNVWWDPTLAVAVQNITDLNFGALGTLPQQVNVGLALHPDLWGLQTTLAVDLVDVAGDLTADDDLAKRLYWGVEVALPRAVTLRAGYHQRYLSAGLTADFWILKLDLATYEEELGAYAGQRGDRRYLGQVILGF